MRRCIVDISMSLDGFIAGPDDEAGLIHEWYFGGDVESRQNPAFRTSAESAMVLAELFRATGALIVGRRTYDLTKGWGGEHPMGAVPVFVVTHRVPPAIPEGITPFTFVMTGVETALELARAEAGERDVVVMGGATLVRECLALGVVDEIQIHLAPVIMGEGVRLFETGDPARLELLSTTAAPDVTHVRYRVVR